jgi:hypothetical protein
LSASSFSASSFIVEESIRFHGLVMWGDDEPVRITKKNQLQQQRTTGPFFLVILSYCHKSTTLQPISDDTIKLEFRKKEKES